MERDEIKKLNKQVLYVEQLERVINELNEKALLGSTWELRFEYNPIHGIDKGVCYINVGDKEFKQSFIRAIGAEVSRVNHIIQNTK